MTYSAQGSCFDSVGSFAHMTDSKGYMMILLFVCLWMNLCHFWCADAHSHCWQSRYVSYQYCKIWWSCESMGGFFTHKVQQRLTVLVLTMGSLTTTKWTEIDFGVGTVWWKQWVEIDLGQFGWMLEIDLGQFGWMLEIDLGQFGWMLEIDLGQFGWMVEIDLGQFEWWR